MKIFRKNKGITLVALVVTIVIMLILASVTLNLALGDNGLVKMATQSVDKYKEASEEEQRQIAKFNAIMNKETYQYTAKDGKTVSIPAGFAPTQIDGEDSVNDGLVITDSEGNEFVWIPCKEIEYVKHQYDNNNDDTSKNITDTAGGWNTLAYRAFSDWKEDGAEENKESIKNNGGFYIARYEAGVPSEATFYVDKNSLEKDYAQDKGKQETSVAGLKPVSQKGKQTWNYITQEHAKEVSEAMYTGKNYGVTSKLVDGIAWDRVVTWMSEDSEYSNIYKDSTLYGNYANRKGNIKFEVSDTLYAEHLYKILNGTVNQGWCIGKHYQYGRVESGNFLSLPKDKLVDADTKYNSYDNDLEKYSYDRYIELATGETAHTMVKNIYDMAGNMYEWTTEYRYVGESDGTKNAVYRSGSFYNVGYMDPISIRIGAYSAFDFCRLYVGFRVVLYVK